MNSALRHLRAIVRASALCGVTTFFYALWLSLRPLLLGSGKASYGWRNFNFRKWAKAAAALLRMRIAVNGGPPRAPLSLVFNHLSYLDMVTLASQSDCIV